MNMRGSIGRCGGNDAPGRKYMASRFDTIPFECEAYVFQYGLLWSMRCTAA